MPFNLLLFPLLGGYWIVVRLKPLKYYHHRIERQKLIFNSVAAGAFLLILSFLFTTFVSLCFPGFVQQIIKLSPVNIPYFGTTLGAFILGILISEVFNVFIKTEKAIIRSIKQIGNELELLFESSWNKPHLILLTLGNNKVYVGWVKSLPIPNHSNYVSILPAMSGYRHGETQELTFTTQYLDVYASYVQDGIVTNIKTLAHLVIKIEEIVSANKFDIETYERFNNLVQHE